MTTILAILAALNVCAIILAGVRGINRRNDVLEYPPEYEERSA